MSTASGRKDTAEIVPLGEARAQRAAAAPSLDDAGAMLRAAREDAGFTVGDVSAEINVKPERLEAIEAMDLAGLPSAPYTLGFVRAYAGFLGLPVEPLVARFREEAGWAKAVTAPVVKAPPPVSRDREIGLVGVLVVAVFIVWAVWQIVGRSPEAEQAIVPEGTPIANRTASPQVVPEVTTSLEDDLTLTPPVVVEDQDRTPANPAGEAAQAPDTAVAEAAATDDAETAGVPPLVPLVLASPVAGRTEAPAADVPATEAEAPLVRSDADALNERLLREVMAGSEPGRRVPDAASETEPTRGAEAVAEPTRSAERPAEPVAPARESAGPVAAEPAPSLASGTSTARVAAQLTDPVSPVYPRRCRRTAGDREVVTVRFTVSRTGRVIGPAVEESTNRCFEDAALAAVSRFGFAPATEGGRAVAETGRTTRIVFQTP